MTTHRFSGSQLNGSALTNSLVITEPLKEPDTPALRPANTNTQHEPLNNSRISAVSTQTPNLTWVEDLGVQHGHVLSTSRMSRK